ncbi:MAG TPA: Gfo/Idh/MocA family oxidoreductase [Candidatus Hydrogenedentes bacterium]|nr:Gfo/Idh/MocA family oxidoreductase [Candidatus Hydrogenedentota bacterium]
MPKMKLRVGVIGVGAIADEMHLPNWQELEAEGRVELMAVCDIRPDRAAEMGAKYGARVVHTDYKKMLRDGSYDIIDVCTQNRFHAPIAIDALKSGANVLVEKPMAMNSMECRSMIQAATDAKKKLMVAQHMRFEAGAEKLKEIIEEGRLGTVYAANATFLRRRGIPGWGKFHIAKESLGGPLIDLGVHVLDLAVWLMGSPKPVAASGKVYRMFGDRPDLCNGEWGERHDPKEFDVEDYASAYVRFENDITLTLDVSWAANIECERSGVSILGDRAGATTSPLAVYGYEGRTLTSTRYDWLPIQEGHRMEIRHFVECLERNRPVRVQPAESLRIQQIIDAIYESSRKNAEVRIKSV